MRVRERRDVLDLAGRDQLAGGAELVENPLGVDGVPGDDYVGHDRQAERLLTLLLRGSLPDVAFVGVEDRARESVELLALAQLTRRVSPGPWTDRPLTARRWTCWWPPAPIPPQRDCARRRGA
jgi:hypothetical protein